MSLFGNVLVVDDSKVFSAAMQTVLAPHADEVAVAHSVGQALDALAQQEPSLLIADVVLPDGDGFEILEQLREHDETGSILVTSRRTSAGARRAFKLGALDYLPKPITLRDIASAWATRSGRVETEPRVKAAPLGFALLGERDADVGLCWEIADLSLGGAFLLTGAPVEIGRVLPLSLRVREASISVLAEVVRVQEPSWSAPGGIGVKLQPLDDSSGSRLVQVLRDLRYAAA